MQKAITLGNVIYYNALSTDCEVVQDGWYYTDETAASIYGFYIDNGVITEIYSCGLTTSTTTTIPASPPKLENVDMSSISNVSDGCGEVLDTSAYIDTQITGIISINDIVYTDIWGTILFVGDGGYYHIETTSGSFSCKIGATGVIQSVALCP